MTSTLLPIILHNYNDINGINDNNNSNNSNNNTILLPLPRSRDANTADNNNVILQDNSATSTPVDSNFYHSTISLLLSTLGQGYDATSSTNFSQLEVSDGNGSSVGYLETTVDTMTTRQITPNEWTPELAVEFIVRFLVAIMMVNVQLNIYSCFVDALKNKNLSLEYPP
jgi:hypothetical protein